MEKREKLRKKDRKYLGREIERLKIRKKGRQKYRNYIDK